METVPPPRDPDWGQTALPRPGQRFGPYQLVEEVARGGQGAVYRARHRELGRTVALKISVGMDPRSVERFRLEAKVLERLEHAHLPRVHDLGVLRGVAFIAMEFIEGETLKAWVERARPSHAETLSVLAAIASALDYCHEEGVVHRDLKPSNVLLERESQRPVVIDFGIVKGEDLDVSEVEISRTGEIKGTPAYMAPEQVSADSTQHPIGPWTDVYGLGATLYHLLSGQAPFAGTSPLNIMSKVVKNDPEPLDPSVPPPLAHACMRALAKLPRDRPKTCGALARLAQRKRVPFSAKAWALLLLVALGSAALGAAALRYPHLFARPAPSPEASPSPQVSPSEAPPPAQELAEAPRWFRQLDAGRRPPLPIPAVLRFGPRRGEYTDHVDGSVFVYVPPTTFVMGPPQASREVKLTRGFYLGKLEVTWRQFRRFCAETTQPLPAPHEGLADEDIADHPVHNVSLMDARAYCAWAKGRLPTEAEWELAARGHDSRPFPWGRSAANALRLNCSDQRSASPSEAWDDGFALTAPVGRFPQGRSPFGCLDMAGNVSEWVQDGYEPATPGPTTDPLVGTRPRGTIRGGDSGKSSSDCRTFTRRPFDLEGRSLAVGFRLCRSAE